MAVEIPVVVDIEQAFNDAAMRVDSAIRPLKQKIDDSTAQLKLKVGAEYDPITDSWKKIEKSVEHIMSLTTNSRGITRLGATTQEVATALEDAKSRYASLMSLQEKGAAIDAQKVYDLRSAISILTVELEQRQHHVNLVTQETEKIIAATRAEEQRNYIIQREAKTVSEINERLGALRGKLDSQKPGSKEWTITAREIYKATSELTKWNKKFDELGTKPGSINRINLQLQELTNKWDAMSKAQKFDKDGNLKASAQKIIEKYRQLTSEAEKYGRSLQSYVKAGTRELQTQQGVLGRLVSTFGYYFSIYSVIRFAKQIRDVTGELEYQRVALQHLIQDEEYGAALFERIKAAAIESPFRIRDLVTYTKQLAAYRIAQEDLFDTTQRLADISAGLGVDMNRLILAYGQVRAASVLRGQELRQFTEAGIPLVELLADKFTELKGQAVSTADVFKLISERAVPFSMVAEIFEDLTEKGGMFFEMQERQAQTLQGRWSKLKDAMDVGLQSIGESKGLLNFYTYNNLILGSLNLLAKNLRIIPKLIEGGTLAWIAYNAALLITGKRTKSVIKDDVELLAMEIAISKGSNEVTKSHLRLAAAQLSLSQATNFLTRSLAKLRIALLTNPWLVAIAGALGVVAALVSFRRASDDATKGMSDMENAIEAMSKANKEFNRTGTLIKRFENLSKNTERTADENLKLAQTMATLREQFPDLIEAIGNENIALDEQVKLLEEARKKRLEDAREKARDELNIEEEKNRMLTDSYNEAVENFDKANKSLIDAQKRRNKGAAELNKELAGTSTRLYTDKELQKAVDDLTVNADNARAAMESANEELEKSNEKIARLKNQIDPQEMQTGWREWQKQIKKTQDSLLKLGDIPVFTEEEIGAFNSVYDLSKKLKKRIDDLTTSLKGMRSQLSNIADKDSDSYKALSGEIKATEKTLEMAEAIRIALGLAFGKGSSSSYTQDPFIKQMQERMKFMKDFQKGYEDLSKYLSKQSALGKESEFMLTRGLSLGLDAAEQKMAAEDLSNWYQGAIENAFKYLQDKKGVTGTWQEFLSRQITGNTNRDKMLRDFQSLMQSLFDAKTDFDVSQEKKNMEEALKKVTEELKRSETARNFYKNILDLTGDEQLAATMAVSVYGDEGEEFKERMQKQLEGALNEMKLRGPVAKDLEDAFKSMDFEKILSVKDLPTEIEKVVRQAYESTQKYNADIANNYSKLLLKFDEIEQQRINITKQSAKDREDIEKGLALEIEGLQKRGATREEIQAAKDRATLAMDAVTRDSETQLFKLREQYRLFFSSVGVISVNSAREVAAKQRKMLTDQFVRGQISLSRYKRELKEIDEQLEKYSGLDKFEKFASGKWGELLVENLSELSDGLISLAATAKTSGGIFSPNDDAKKFIDRVDSVLNFGDFASIFTGKKKIDIRAEANKAGRKAYMDAIAQGKSVKIANSEADAAVRKVFDRYSQKMDEMAEAFAGFASAIMALLAALDKIGAGGRDIFDQIERSGHDVDLYLADFFAGVSDFFGGILDFLKLDFSGGFSRFANLMGDARYYNREIKNQSVLLDKLQYQYDRLGAVIEDSFGAEYIYNYNKQLENLVAQAEAYRKQAEAERAKGKAADEDVAKGYDKSARDIEDRIAEMQSQLSEFFSGTDLTSAAEDFASAWIEAYKEFGSTTDAMSEKFNDMIESMINRSLAAKIMQEMLQPIFDQIDTLAKDGLLSTTDIASIAALAQERIPMINEAMTNLMTSLASAGLDVRASTAGFKGISRDIAGASEESILGLAAAVNTQNYYISYVPQINENVAAILAAMTGGSSPATSVETNEAGEVMPSVQKMVYDHLPNMDANMAEMLRLFRSVITTKTNSTNTAYIAVK